MSELEDNFAKLLGTQPTDKDRNDLYRVRDALGLKSNDALWLVLMALQHYQSQYERVPARIEEAARRTLQNFGNAAEATAKATTESARRQVADAAARAAWDVVQKVETRERLKWLCTTMLTCVLAVAALALLMHFKGTEAGYALGYAKGYEAAKAAANSSTRAADGLHDRRLNPRGRP